ncbi:hypothetical protein [Fibrobacter sp. UWR2]|uniref:hypothetical protein n=1 Tax=Fibrobacter sp. UWR2 TaxID=1964352 RepID=UPI000B525809|nr:hypothetical protein [Fibrobacter sp. UWR2]OWV00623.1 hypothetical protein B7994_06055 [Fibrobacter sp. UWR2]
MRFLVPIVLAVAVIALAFNLAKPLPSTNFDESFLPKASSVKYVAAGHDASVAGLFWIKGLTELGESYLTGKEYAYLGHVANLCTELDSLFYTPYYFISGVTPIDAPDTSDLVVLRRAVRVYPEKWRVAVSLALRLAKGPYPDKQAAADVMRPYFNSTDTTMPEHIRMMYRSFELDMEQTETAIEMILNDVMQPRFKKFRKSFSNKAFRALGYGGYGSVSGPDSTVYKEIEKTIEAFVDGKVPPMYAYSHLLALKKVEKKEEETAAVEPAAETTEKPVDGATGNAAETPAN